MADFHTAANLGQVDDLRRLLSSGAEIEGQDDVSTVKVENQ